MLRVNSHTDMTRHDMLTPEPENQRNLKHACEHVQEE